MASFRVFSNTGGHDLADGLGPFDTDQALLEPVVEAGQLIGVESELVLNRCVQVLDVKENTHDQVLFRFHFVGTYRSTRLATYLGG